LNAARRPVPGAFAEFVGTRRLAARLKKEDEMRRPPASRLAKPSYTAWLVNQL
jgi:hypothetical protein